MHYNHYGQGPVRLAVSLVNDPPETPADLEKRLVDESLVLEDSVTAAVMRVIREFLRRWETVVDATDDTGRAERLNPLLAEYTAAPRLTDHAGDGWHMHFRAERLPVDRQVCALIAVGTALHLTGRGMDRLGRCRADGCARVYADTSRNGRQRYCSPGCGNRDAVRRHRSQASAA
ncbi:CGNR zinc finger protein [Stackebrandtia endophytica]|uniref:CGNR zinc finger protein n=1 Tax=Stackebrandtia endophytica TaxID=1496996 RepID=A0A543AVP6_9ACTN|nr:CGNR zinc finger domain-containing protein [Stackebrandtia endophytica]TQL76653.1 CGNR zinc finger protein [Stackebrandtia endophytica]